MKKLLLSSLCAAVVILLNSCSTPPPPDTEFNYSSDDPYRMGQNLVEAIAHGANSAAYRLMENGAPLNYQDKKDEWTPLVYAIYHRNWRMAKVLIRAGANVNLADSANRSPLMWSALRNSGITATLLVEYGADINAVDVSGRTALQYAVIYTNYTLAAYLAEAGRRPPSQRLRKEQFSRLNLKRVKAKAEAKNLKLFGKKNEREIIAKMNRGEINGKTTKTVKPVKAAPKKDTKTTKTVEPVKAAPKEAAKKPVKISDLLKNINSAENKALKDAAPVKKAAPLKAVPMIIPKEITPVKDAPVKTIIPAPLRTNTLKNDKTNTLKNDKTTTTALSEAVVPRKKLVNETPAVPFVRKEPVKPPFTKPTKPGVKAPFTRPTMPGITK